ncbi:MAG: BrnA antitoxin family protein [Rhodospirillales bacterium]
MAKKQTLVRYSAEQLATMPSETDWARVDAMTQEEVERMADEDDGPLPEGWEKTIVLGAPEPKQDVHIRLDPAVLRWFKAHGPGYQTRINEVLRAFVQAKLQGGGNSDDVRRG